MLLYLTTIDTEGQVREFSCQLKQLEAGFDFLSTIVSRGDRLIQASTIDNNQVTELPTEAFDGYLFSKIIRELEAEWETILSTPSRYSVISQPTGGHIQHWLNIYEERIISLELTTTKIEVLLEQANKSSLKLQSLVEHYETIHKRYAMLLIKAYSIREQLLERIDDTV